jgi:hypothetical protein
VADDLSHQMSTTTVRFDMCSSAKIGGPEHQAIT